MIRSATRRLSVAAICTFMAAASVSLGAPAAGADPIYPVAATDPFYAQSAGIDDVEVGDPLDVRPMPPIAAFPATDVWQVKFRSTNSQLEPIAATTTVLVPHNRPVDGPLLSYQHIINALSPRCSPSRTLYETDPDLIIREAPALNVALQRGWTVALPDHLGPTAAYGAAKLGGYITLDGIRAVQQVPHLKLVNSPVGMAGYSGGGMATAWAAALAPEYAPDLNIVGVAEGGVPMNIGKMANALSLQPHPAFGLALAAAIGLEREYPERLPISEQLNEEGLQLRNEVANACTNGLLTAGAGKSAAQIAKTTDMMTSEEAWAVLDENSVELYPGVPTAPIFEWHSPTDALIPVDSIDNTIRRYCEAGATVQSELFPTPDHLSAAALGAPQALEYLDARFRGVPAPSNC
ncbi:MAG: lipase [Rhodococcus sp.]|nr:lipase [Rhodococcus sp. (in: high G+C Gram-positive bacteria)]